MSSRSSACDAGGHVSNFDASWLSAKQSNACKVAARTTRLHACKARMGGRLALCGDDRILGHLRVGIRRLPFGGRGRRLHVCNLIGYMYSTVR